MTLLQRDREKFAEGKAEGKLEDIQNLMENLNLSAEKAMKALGIPESEYEKYKEML